MIDLKVNKLEELSGEQTIKLIKSANDKLRNSRSSGIMQRLDDIVKLIILKVYDEIEVETNEKIEYDFQTFKEDDVESVYTRLTQLFIRNINSPQFAMFYPASQKNFSTDKEAIYEISKLWGNYSFRKSFEDVKGVAFQEILKNTFDKNENQQFFTPTESAEFMAALALEMLKQKKIQRVAACDPAIGTGGLLLQLNKLSNGTKQGLDIDYFGADYDEKMAWLSAINIYLSTNKQGKIFWDSCIGGSLNKEKSSIGTGNTYDLILSNPPFGSDISSEEVLSQFQLGNKNSRRRSILFMERNLELLKPGGILIMVIDESVLNSDKTGDVRKYIRKHANIKAVFSLPDSAFLPYATVKTSILVLEKKDDVDLSADETVLYYEILNTGRKANGDIDYIKDSTGKKIKNEDFQSALAVFKDFLENKDLKEDNNTYTIITNNDFIDHAKENKVVDWKETRIDMLPYHPIVRKSNKVLVKSKNIFELKDIITIRSERVNPIQSPDKLFKYIGLANIEKETGEIEVEDIFGDDIKSTCNKFYGEDIIFARMRPELRKVALISSDLKEGICSSECAVIYINDEFKNKILKQYLAWILKSDLFYGQVMGKVTGIGRPRVSSKGLLNCKIPIPSFETQQAIIKNLDSAKDKLLSVRKEIHDMYTKSESEFHSKIKNIDQLLD